MSDEEKRQAYIEMLESTVNRLTREVELLQNGLVKSEAETMSKTIKTMNEKVGYYSILQYCPDRSRGEAANVGVLLFVPECDFLKIRLTENNDHVLRFFGAKSFDDKWLSQAKLSAANRLLDEKALYRDSFNLVQFVQTFANELSFTDPRSVRVTNPEEDLDMFFSQLVEEHKDENTQ